MGSIGGNFRKGPVGSSPINRTKTTKTLAQLKSDFPTTISIDSLTNFCDNNEIKGPQKRFIEEFGKQLNTSTLNPGKRIGIALQLVEANKVDELNMQALANEIATADVSELTTADNLLAKLDNKLKETTTDGETDHYGEEDRLGSDKELPNEVETTPVPETDPSNQITEASPKTFQELRTEITKTAQQLAQQIQGKNSKDCDEAFFEDLKSRYTTLIQNYRGCNYEARKVSDGNNSRSTIK